MFDAAQSATFRWARSYAKRAVYVGFALVAIASTGCSSQCDRHPDEPPTVFTDGFTDQHAHVYWSSPDAKDPWSGPWLDFPPGRTYRFIHHLGGIPRDPEYWFSFNPNPIPQGAGNTSGFVAGAGNQGTWQSMTADHADIRNDTCSDVFLLVRLADPFLEATNGGDSGVEGGP